PSRSRPSCPDAYLQVNVEGLTVPTLTCSAPRRPDRVPTRLLLITPVKGVPLPVYATLVTEISGGNHCRWTPLAAGRTGPRGAAAGRLRRFSCWRGGPDIPEPPAGSLSAWRTSLRQGRPIAQQTVRYVAVSPRRPDAPSNEQRTGVDPRAS